MARFTPSSCKTNCTINSLLLNGYLTLKNVHVPTFVSWWCNLGRGGGEVAKWHIFGPALSDDSTSVHLEVFADGYHNRLQCLADSGLIEVLEEVSNYFLSTAQVFFLPYGCHEFFCHIGHHIRKSCITVEDPCRPPLYGATKQSKIVPNVLSAVFS